MIKRTIDHIRKLNPAERKSLVEILGGGKKGDISFISQTLTTPVGLFRVLQSLSNEEYRVFLEACRDASGATLGQLELALKLKREEIDAIADALEKKLLAFVIKNRQHLHNKSDRLIAFEDIREEFKPQEIAHLKEMYQTLYETAINRKDPKKQKSDNKKSVKRAVIARLIRNGGIASVKELTADAESKATLSVVDELLKKNIVTLIHTPEPPFDALAALTPHALEEAQWPLFSNKSSHNRYNLLLNILIMYDIVSTYGLFLTQQDNFRKIDLDRILDALLPIEGISGKKISPSEIFQLCISLLHRHKMAEISDDSVHLSLAPLSQHLNHPDGLLFALIAEGEPKSGHRLIAPPFQPPALGDIRKMIEVLMQLETAPMLLVLFASVAAHMRQMQSGPISEVPALAKKQMELCEQTLHFLHIIGATTIAHGEISLSDVGYSLAEKLSLPTPSAHTHTSKKLLYINPDYTVLIPHEGLLSKEYYVLLSRMELSKDDVIIHAKITHRSILNAYKRGMNVDEFIRVLEPLSKTPLPQNLSFMLKEWTKQAIEVHISQTIIIKANHSSFLDELQAGKLQHAITERLTPTIAIIRKDSIDDIVKFARRKDAIIRLFE